MAKRSNELGTVGEAVAANVANLRRQKGYSCRSLEARLAEMGYRMSHTAITKLEAGHRRTEVDDVRALADALDVAMITLLMPVTDPTRRSDARQVAVQEFVEHHTGRWPKGYPKPLQTSQQVTELGAFWTANDYTSTGRKKANKRAVGAQIELLEVALRTQQRAWKEIQANSRAAHGGNLQSLALLRDSVRASIGNVTRTLAPLQNKMAATDWAHAQRIEDQTLDLFTTVNTENKKAIGNKADLGSIV